MNLGALALEPQHAHAQDVGPRQAAAEAFGDRAEVLADDHAAGALALERDMADEVVERIGEIGALGRLGALGDEEQALQAHRMVDAQHAGVAHVGGVERARGPPSRRRAPSSGLGAGRFQFWPSVENGSGGAPTDDAAREFARAAPRPRRRRAPRRPRDRDRSRARARACAPAPRRARAGGRRAIGRRARSRRPAGRLAIAAASAFGVGVAQRLGPGAPVRAGFARRDRLEGGEAPQRLAARGDEGAIVGEERIVGPRGRARGESGVERRERGALDRPDRGIIDEPRSPRPPAMAGRERRRARPRAPRRAAGRGRATSMRIGSRKRRSEG